jgi:hypothetical protein
MDRNTLDPDSETILTSVQRSLSHSHLTAFSRVPPDANITDRTLWHVRTFAKRSHTLTAMETNFLPDVSRVKRKSQRPFHFYKRLWYRNSTFINLFAISIASAIYRFIPYFPFICYIFNPPLRFQTFLNFYRLKQLSGASNKFSMLNKSLLFGNF